MLDARCGRAASPENPSRSYSGRLADASRPRRWLQANTRAGAGEPEMARRRGEEAAELLGGSPCAIYSFVQHLVS